MTAFPKKAFWNIRRLEDVILSWRFLFTVNRDENIFRESFSLIIIYVLRYHLSRNIFLMILFNVVFLTTQLFPSWLDVSIV